MPKSKHRRKPDGKAVAHPGRGKPGRPATLSWLDELEEASGVSGLPLFDWADTNQDDRQQPPDLAEDRK
jgi:hypothetical protein